MRACALRGAGTLSYWQRARRRSGEACRDQACWGAHRRSEPGRARSCPEAASARGRSCRAGWLRSAAEAQAASSAPHTDRAASPSVRLSRRSGRVDAPSGAAEPAAPRARAGTPCDPGTHSYAGADSCAGPKPAHVVLRRLGMRVPDDRRKRLVLAAETRTSIRHPHLLPARIVRDDRGRLRILLQRQPVPTLSEVLASGPLDVRTSLRLLFGVATAVDALSKAGLVARELKPDRILVCPRRGGILADPGIPLELLPRDSSPDDPDSPYRSPEEQAGLPIDARSNVYSLAAVFLATMTAPDGERLALPAPAKAVIGRAMAIEPERRYASPPEFIVTLASAFGFRQRASNGAKRSSAATPKGEAAAVTEPSSVPEPRASAQTVASPRQPNAAPEPARAESEPHETRPRRSPDQNGSRAAREQAVPPPSRPERAPARRPPSEAAPAHPEPPRSGLAPNGAKDLPEEGPDPPGLACGYPPRLACPCLPCLGCEHRLCLACEPQLPRVRATAMRRLSAPTLPRLRAPSRHQRRGDPLRARGRRPLHSRHVLGRNAKDEPQPALDRTLVVRRQAPGRMGRDEGGPGGRDRPVRSGRRRAARRGRAPGWWSPGCRTSSRSTGAS